MPSSSWWTRLSITAKNLLLSPVHSVLKRLMPSSEWTFFLNSGQIIHDLGVRRISLKSYPYQIIYILNPDGLYVLAFAHSRRDPDYWLYRLGL